jgi:serine/threonine-protein kinase
MAIAAGALFGSYRVEESIGAGGMGEVYRARDTELGRDVAIKVLPASFSSDAMRVARFEQEAKTLAALNHSNIAHIYGLARGEGGSGIVMELVDGPTIADRIAAGPIPIDEALRIAAQIADALEAAHTRGIVHRDLKPANVKLAPDGTVKVLDFGIAKALDPRFLTGPGPAALTTPAMTQAGIVLGTAAYMSPEQARGKVVDQRTDVWAFGCVLYEMLAGKPVFLGEDVTSTLARVLEVGVDMSALPSRISPAVRRTIELCLEKDFHKRIADMRDVKLALAGTFATAAPGAAPRSGLALPLAAAALAALVAGAAVWLLRPAPVDEPNIVTRFEYVFPPDMSLRAQATSVLDIAPSGQFFAFNGTDAIYVRRMNELEARPVPGTAGGIVDVVISPDEREIAFFQNSPPQLLKIAISGGAPVVLAAPIQLPFGLSWEPNGTLYFGQPDGIWRVSDHGGTAERVIELGGAQQAYGPQLLPGGEWLLFTLSDTPGRAGWNEADIVVQSLQTGERRMLRSGGFDARYLPSGHLTYVFQNTLFASAFDADTLTLDDERVPLVQGVQTSNGTVLGGAAFYAVSNDGTLVHIPGAVDGGTERPRRGLAWVDRQGNATTLPIRPDNYTMARISPDGKRIALVVGSTLPATDPLPDIYVYDLETENLTQLTFSPTPDDGPVWSRDSSTIFFRAYDETGVASVSAISAAGGTPELRAKSEAGDHPLPWSMSADGETLLLVDASTLQDVNFSMVRLGSDTTTQPLLDLTEQVSEPALSPNGEWLLYYEFPDTSNIRAEIAIRPFPGVRQQRRPVGPGIHPIFSPSGLEIFAFDGAGLVAAPVQYSPFRVGNLRKLFGGRFWYGVAGPEGALGRAWDVDPNNDRFLMITLGDTAVPGAEERPRIHATVHWVEELRRRVPAPGEAR